LASAPAAAVLPTADAPRVASADAAAPVPATLVLTGKLLRDAQLDAYLAAHEQFAGSSALGMPSAFLRSATVGAPGR
jgi:sigma-E factor negative regulatory protein RseA